MDVSKDNKFLAKLRKQAKLAKEQLTVSEEFEINAEGVVEFTYELGRAEFEAICEPIFAKLQPLLETALKNSGLNNKANI